MKKFCYVVLLILFAGHLTANDAPGVDEIVAKANQAAYYAGQDGRATVTMTITDGSGGERVREFTILRLNTEGENTDGLNTDGA